MSDNIEIFDAGGSSLGLVRADEIGLSPSIYLVGSKIYLGEDGDDDGPVSSLNPLPIAGNTSKDGSGIAYALKLNSDGRLEVVVISGSFTAVVVESSFDHGRKSAIGNTAVQLIVASTPVARGVLVKADPANTDAVWLGNSDVTCDAADATDGLPIAAGEAVEIEIDDVNKLYARSPTAGQKVFWLKV